VWFFIPEKDVGDGGYIHPLPLQVLVSGEGEACVAKPILLVEQTNKQTNNKVELVCYDH
jgi:hypothetical protein